MRQQSPWPRWDNLCCGLSHVFHRIPSPKYLTCSIGTWQRKRTQCRQRCGVGHAGAVSREDHLAVTKAFQCLADVVPATLAHPADMREVDFEGHPLAPVAGLVADRKSVGQGKSVSVRVGLGGRRNIKK